MNNLNALLVGGAVRDRLLGLPVHERDWVVIGSTPEQMAELGFRPVGSDFPVFLHPDTQEEYALARTERKQGRGYHGFTFNSDPSITLEEDLSRRDLTINAMAETADGVLVDPYNGQADLRQKVLRHVSPAFAEDPVRVLRLARFHARLAPLGFTVAPETLELMRGMVASGEVDTLVPERVWQELLKALQAAAPRQFIETLRNADALQRILPEVDALFGVDQRADYHPEIDTGLHTLMSLDAITILSDDPLARFATLVHDLGKAVTPDHILPSHRGHEETGVPLVEQLCHRLKAPREYRELGVLTSRWHLHVHRAFELKPQTLLKFLHACDIYRRPERLEALLLAAEADSKGRTGFEDRDYPQADFCRDCAAAARQVDSNEIAKLGLKGPAIGEAMQKARLAAVKRVVLAARESQ